MQSTPTPPAPATATIQIPGQPQVTISPGAGSPHAVYLALREKREVLGDQMSRLLNRREAVTRDLNAAGTAGSRAALEQHLQELNRRIIDMEKQLHAADAEVAAAAGVPGARPAERIDVRRDGPPEEVFVIMAAFTGIAIMVLAIAYARRLWRGVANVVAQLPPSVESRLSRFEESLDTIAIEVERVSEGQRYLTRVLTENARVLGAGAAQPIEAPAAADPGRRNA